MSRINQYFQTLQNQGKTALIPYIMAGDPDPDVTVPIMHTLVKHGADMIELGIPFSDPMADGPVIQKASERALAHKTSLADVMEMVSRFRDENNFTPVILMGYMNPVEVMGYNDFASKAGSAGVDGVLIVDLPPEESGELQQKLVMHELDQIFLIAPTTSATRMRQLCRYARGFIYYVSLKGVTGSNLLNIQDVRDKLDTIRRITELPVGVGFGIKDADSAAKVARIADAVIIGSALVDHINGNGSEKNEILRVVSSFISDIRISMDKAY